MKVILLPSILPGKLNLEAINRQLQAGEVTLDWSNVQEATDAQLQTLLAGAGLVDSSEVLGLATVPDALAEAIGQVFAEGHALPATVKRASPMKTARG